jgi:ferredoxin
VSGPTETAKIAPAGPADEGQRGRLRGCSQRGQEPTLDLPLPYRGPTSTLAAKYTNPLVVAEICDESNSRMKVTIDSGKCRGHALCLGIAPDAFDFVDLDEQSVVRDGAEERVPLHLLLAAERECPERAITVVQDNSH